MNPFALRPARPEDAPAMKRCVEAAYSMYIPRMGKPPGPMLEDYSEIVRNHQAFIAEERGEMAGLLVLMELEYGILLDNVAVFPAHQGRGLGSWLVALAEEKARDQEYEFIYLYTNETMTENLEMYRRRGYVETERRREKGYDRIYMRKRL